jgi:hypothetical protein
MLATPLQNILTPITSWNYSSWTGGSLFASLFEKAFEFLVVLDWGWFLPDPLHLLPKTGSIFSTEQEFLFARRNVPKEYNCKLPTISILFAFPMNTR